MLRGLWVTLFGVIAASCGPRGIAERLGNFAPEHLLTQPECAYHASKCDVQIYVEYGTEQSQFQPYRSLYEDLTGQSTAGTKFFFGDLSGIQDESTGTLVIAFCDRKSRDIFIDRNLWTTRTVLKRQELLMLHELGHCVGNLPHDDATLSIPPECTRRGDTSHICFSKRPQSIMHPILFREDLYALFEVEYHVDLASRTGRVDEEKTPALRK